MDIRQLEFFVAVAEELNFTRAAELTHVTQPGLSSAIRALERELRAQLFERTPRAVHLTSSGHAFLPRARRMLDDALAAQRELRDNDDAGTLSLGSEQCLGDLVDLPDLFAAFQTRHPQVSIRFEQRGSKGLLDRLHRDELDTALVALPGPAVLPSTLTSFEVGRDGFELLRPAGQPGPADWAELERTPFIDFDTDWTARRIVDDAFAARRLTRRSAFVVEDVHMLLGLVRAGLGVALVPASIAAKPDAEGLVRHPLDEPDLTWSVHLVAAVEQRPVVRRFAEMIVATDVVSQLRDDVVMA